MRKIGDSLAFRARALREPAGLTRGTTEPFGNGCSVSRKRSTFRIAAANRSVRLSVDQMIVSGLMTPSLGTITTPLRM